MCHHYWFYIYVHMHELYTLCRINHHFDPFCRYSHPTNHGNHGDSSGFGQNQPMSTPPAIQTAPDLGRIQPAPGTFCSAERFLQRIYLYLASRSSCSSFSSGNAKFRQFRHMFVVRGPSGDGVGYVGWKNPTQN